MALLLLLMPWPHALAKQLSDEVCAKLAEEHAELRKSGVEEAMEHDPVKATAELEEEDLARIERYLFIEGEISFRCPGIRLPGPTPPETAKTTDGEKKTSQKKPVEKKQPLPKKTDDSWKKQPAR